MKWAATLDARLQAMGKPLAAACIDYRKYKRLGKRAAAADLVTSLETDCRKADGVFRSCFDRRRATDRRRPSFASRLLACCRAEDAPSREQLRSFVTANRTTLMKLTKRLEKRGADPQHHVRRWFNTVSTVHAYAFLGSWRTAALFTDLPAQCPVCLDDDVTSIAVARCGHHLCRPCLAAMYGTHNRRGTLQNLISVEECRRPTRCPVCRMVAPFANVKLLSTDAR